MSNISASAKALQQIHHVDGEISKQVRHAWKYAKYSDLLEMLPIYAKDEILKRHNLPLIRELRRMVVDSLIDTYGVEYLGIYKPSGEHVYYCNAGDTYAITVVFIGNRLIVSTCGDIVERNKIQENNFY